MFPGTNPKDFLKLLDQALDTMKQMKEIGAEFEKVLGEVTPIIGHPEGASVEDKLNAMVRMQGVMLVEGTKALKGMVPLLDNYVQMMGGVRQLLEQEIENGTFDPEDEDEDKE